MPQTYSRVGALGLEDMLSDYIRAVMRRAHYRLDEEGEIIFGEIPGLEGVEAKGRTLEACRNDLAEALEEWIFFRISRKLPLPAMDGIEPPPRDLH